MPVSALGAYLDKLPVRMAEVKLMMADVVSLPKMKKRDRDATLNRWMRIVDIQSPAPSRPASKARLKMMGIGVRYVR